MEELKTARDYDQVCHILKAAFLSNDFDGFELIVEANEDYDDVPAGGDTFMRGRDGKTFHFEKPETAKFQNGWAAWHLTLELVTSTDQFRGSLKIYRFYSDRALLVDTNLLTLVFPVVLADALDRSIIPKPDLIPEIHTTTNSDLTAAEAS